MRSSRLRSRPYERMRRAWHSDRHRSLRRSILLQLLRMAHDVHSRTTRKNREWQEKLPAVAARAEEILYSKAASEAEYADLSTLWSRANDTIDTIINNDDGSDDPDNTMDVLLPCIEAALILGCVPKRASRGRGCNDHAAYLSPTTTTTDDRLPCQYSELFELADTSPSDNSNIDLNVEHGNGMEASAIDVRCDLSLRLGLPSQHSQILGTEGSCLDNVEGAGSS